MITLKEAMEARHSVRSYLDKPLTDEIKSELCEYIRECNVESGLNIQLVTDEPKAFDSFLAHYGKFSGVKNYIAMIGRNDSTLDEKCGYYGEKLVLRAQQLGLNSCWVALTYKKIKTAFTVSAGEKLCVVIAVGYGATSGVPHKSKGISDVAKYSGEMPGWFKSGVEAALLAPTAMNQQKFIFELSGEKVAAKSGSGFYTKVDLGIAKLHFELAAGKGHLA